MSENQESATPPSPPPPGAPPPPPPSSPKGGGDDPNRTLMLVLAYLGPLALVPFVTEKGDKEVQWHAKHGLVLLAAEVIVAILLSVFLGILPFTGCLLPAVLGIFWLGLAVLHFVCIFKAVKGERLLIPGVSPYADRF